MRLLQAMALVTVIGLAAMLGGCEEKKGPLEKAADSAGNAVKATAKDADKAGSRAKEDMKQAAEELKR